MPQDDTSVNPINPTTGTNPPVLPTVSSPQPMGAPQPMDSSQPAFFNPAAEAAPMPEPSPMPEPTTPPPSTSSVVFDPTQPVVMPTPPPATDTPTTTKVINKIRESKNVLIALSSDPSVDEMATAIGLSLFLDKLGKRATAIYSGATPNALEFLKPEETFEPSADTLQDFVIALNKEKADHLRYKLDGDFVKIYITPYKTRIDEQDLDFSYGDYNVDLVLALDVANGVDLDSALREHGRIMHDASIVNITTGNPGKFGEIEWSDKSASSLAEMISKLLYTSGGDVTIGKEEATAFLTGIVAATNRFSNASTTPETMTIASKLMESGANQQLISKNITPDIENEIYSLSSNPASDKEKEEKKDPTSLDIDHEAEADDTNSPDLEDTDTGTEKEVSAKITEREHTLLDDLKVAEANLSQAGAEASNEPEPAPLRIEDQSDDNEINNDNDSAAEQTDDVADDNHEPTLTDGPVENSEEDNENVLQVSPEPSSVNTTLTDEYSKPQDDITVESSNDSASPVESIPEPTPTLDSPSSFDNQSQSEPEPTPTPSSVPIAGEPAPEDVMPAGKVIQPSEELGNELKSDDDNANKYGHMLEDALANTEQAPVVNTPIIGNDNPATTGAPIVPSSPDINGVPEINYAPVPNNELLPPPPAPPIGDAGMPTPMMSLPATPTSADNPSSFAVPNASPAATDPSTFQIPGLPS